MNIIFLIPNLAKAKMTNKPPLPIEDPNDPFDRQRCLSQFDHSLIEQQVALILGCGGLGCTVAFALARLGIKKMIFIDYDKVDMSNLNRQILFSRKHVGMSKVEAAMDGIKPHLVGNTEVIGFHLDAVKNWGRIVELARESTVIFNNIDFGQYFDYACLNLAKSLQIPYVAGSSYARTWIVEFYTGRPGVSSFSLVNIDGDKEIIALLHDSLIQSYEALDFIKKDKNPPTRTIGSNVLVCCSAGLMTVNAWVQDLMGISMPNYTKFDIATITDPNNLIAWPHPVEETVKI